jgi:hypothetical protein
LVVGYRRRIAPPPHHPFFIVCPDQLTKLAGVKRTAPTKQTARVQRIFRKLRGVQEADEHELWQHALYFAKTPEERCRISLQTAHSALSLRRSGRKKSPAS